MWSMLSYLSTQGQLTRSKSHPAEVEKHKSEACEQPLYETSSSVDAG